MNLNVQTPVQLAVCSSVVVDCIEICDRTDHFVNRRIEMAALKPFVVVDRKTVLDLMHI